MTMLHACDVWVNGQWVMEIACCLLPVGDLNGGAAMIFAYQIIYSVYYYILHVNDVWL